jgi:hypothetical protein
MPTVSTMLLIALPTTTCACHSQRIPTRTTWTFREMSFVMAMVAAMLKRKFKMIGVGKALA